MRTFLASHNPDTDSVFDPLDTEGDMRKKRFGSRLAVQHENEDLILVHRTSALARHRGPNGRSAGGEGEGPLAADLLTAQRLQPDFHTELALHPGRQVAAKIEHPVPAVGPACCALLRTDNVERINQATGIAQRDDGLRKPGADLADALDLALRGEHLNARAFLGVPDRHS